MPKAIEDKLKAEAAKQASNGKLRKVKGETAADAKNKYVYGTMAKLKKKYGIK